MKLITTLLFLSITLSVMPSLAEDQIYATQSEQYRLHAEAIAGHCEFYVDTYELKDRYVYHGASHNYLEIYFHVNRGDLENVQHGKVLQLGAKIKMTEQTDDNPEQTVEKLVYARSILGTAMASRYSQSQNFYYLNEIMNARTFGRNTVRRIQEISFFLDIKRSNYKVHRLWIKNAEKTPFGPVDLDTYMETRSPHSSDYDVIAKLGNGSPVFHQRSACQ